jgi:hypothetical protein
MEIQARAGIRRGDSGNGTTLDAFIGKPLAPQTGGVKR